MNAAGLTRSMSSKGKTGDNAACEGFFKTVLSPKTCCFRRRVV